MAAGRRVCAGSFTRWAAASRLDCKHPVPRQCRRRSGAPPVKLLLDRLSRCSEAMPAVAASAPDTLLFDRSSS